MSWNKPYSKKPQSASTSRVTLLFILAALAIAGILSVILRRSDSTAPAPAPASAGSLPLALPVPPRAAAKSEASEPLSAEPSKREKDLAMLKRIRDKYGDDIPENLKAVVYFIEHPPTQTFHPARTKESVFKHQSERVLASFLSVEPGTWFMRKQIYDDRFDRDLAVALEDQIEFSEDDTDEQRELKKSVIETKREFAERIAAGERASDLMNAISEDYYALGQFKRELQETIAEYKRNPSCSDQDLAALVTEANKMLAERNLPPLRMPNMVLRHVSLKRAAARKGENGK